MLQIDRLRNDSHDVKPVMVDTSVIREEAGACGKAIIVGEHAVVYGARAIALPLTSMSIRLKADFHLRDEYPGSAERSCDSELWLSDSLISDQGSEVLRDAMQLLNLPKGRLSIRGTSSLPIGAGLGSSATLCVALLRVLTRLIDRTMPLGELAELANTLERRFHGNPSGLDTAVVAYEAIVAFRRAQTPAIIKARAPKNSAEPCWRFAIIDSGIRASTMVMVKAAAPYFKGEMGEHRLRLFETMADQVFAGLTSGDELAVADGMTHANILLTEAGVSNPKLQEIIDICAACGCLAAKLTGAGGGGAVLALLSPQLAEQQLTQLRQQLGEALVYEVKLP